MSPEEQVPDERTKHLAYAEASLVLIECLLLTLLEQRVLSKEQIIAAVEAAVATKRQMLLDHEDPQITAIAAGVLKTMANSVAAAQEQPL
jgi:hypothetical protein